jgi:hypothetical protein
MARSSDTAESWIHGVWFICHGREID